MKKIFFLFFAICSMSLFAQTDTTGYICKMPEIMPEFPGGQSELFKFLGETIHYPEEIVEQHIEGRVICQFIVDADGSIQNAQVVKGVHPLLDAEALRAIGLMPKWIPGVQNGKQVRTIFTLPIKFKLQEESQQLKENAEETRDNVAFIDVEQMPEFPGGQSALFNYLSETVKYPQIAKENNIQGKVIVQFVVEKDGSISNVQVVRSVDPSLDKEARRVIASMPKWRPGKQRGEYVRVKYTVPVNFRLKGK